VTIEKSSSINFSGKKVSGSAGYARSGWYLHHATLLVSVDLNKLSKSLLASPEYGVTSSRRSNFFPTTNLPDYFSIKAWKTELVDIMTQTFKIGFAEDSATRNEEELTDCLADTMYSRPAWIFEMIRDQTCFSD
jgi:lipoate-protein ligase A